MNAGVCHSLGSLQNKATVEVVYEMAKEGQQLLVLMPPHLNIEGRAWRQLNRAGWNARPQTCGIESLIMESARCVKKHLKQTSHAELIWEKPFISVIHKP